MANREFNEKNSLTDIAFFGHGCCPLVLHPLRVLFVLCGADVVGHVCNDLILWTSSGERGASICPAKPGQGDASLWAVPHSSPASVDIMFILDPSVSVCTITLSFHGCLRDS